MRTLILLIVLLFTLTIAGGCALVSDGQYGSGFHTDLFDGYTYGDPPPERYVAPPVAKVEHKHEFRGYYVHGKGWMTWDEYQFYQYGRDAEWRRDTGFNGYWEGEAKSGLAE